MVYWCVFLRFMYGSCSWLNWICVLQLRFFCSEVSLGKLKCRLNHYLLGNKAVGVMKAGQVFTIEPMINSGQYMINFFAAYDKIKLLNSILVNSPIRMAPCSIYHLLYCVSSALNVDLFSGSQVGLSFMNSF